MDLDHGWDRTHQVFNEGHWDQWLPTKTTTCMAYPTGSDIPFRYAPADAFKVCGGYYRSVLGPTDPNHYYMWTLLTRSPSVILVTPRQWRPTRGRGVGGM